MEGELWIQNSLVFFSLSQAACTVVAFQTEMFSCLKKVGPTFISFKLRIQTRKKMDESTNTERT